MSNRAHKIAAASEGGALPFALPLDGTKNGVIKAGAGQLYGISCGNINAAPAYLKLYDMITAPATTDTPVYRFMIPGNAAGAGREKVWPVGLKFAVGIAWRLVTTLANDGDTAVAANEVTVSGDYL